MRTITKEELKKALDSHKLFLITNGEEGKIANFSNTNLSGADLRGAYLSYANLDGAEISYADLRGADLSYANLSEANLFNANLREGNLFNADLRGAYLSYAYLSGADLGNTNLRGADLDGADLGNANLRGADLRGADIESVISDLEIFIFSFKEYNVSIVGDMVKAGCQEHSIDQWFAFSKKEIAEMDGKESLKFYPMLLKTIKLYTECENEFPEWIK